VKYHHFVFVAALCSTLAIGYLDLQTGAQISLMLLYALPILAAAWTCGKVESITVAVIAAACWLLVNLEYNLTTTSGAILSWNALTRFGIFLLIAYTASLQASLKRSFEREKLRADTDRLTGLLNKAAFRDRVEDEMIRAQRYNHPLSLAFIDLDNFKQINDSQGHARGDKLLRHVSETIITTVRETDVVGRIGGDEFSVCFPETGEEQVRKAVEKLIKALNIMTSQSGWQVTASIGVVTCLEICGTYDVILGKADKLMYEVKRKGKNAAEFETIN